MQKNVLQLCRMTRYVCAQKDSVRAVSCADECSGVKVKIAVLWCCTIKVDIENSKGQYIEKDKQEATKDGSESTKIQHGI